MKIIVPKWIYMTLVISALITFVITLNELVLSLENLKYNLPLALNILSIIMILIIQFGGIDTNGKK